MVSMAVVLAGGASRRMGTNKLALPRWALQPTPTADRQSILQHVVSVTTAIADSVVVCTSSENVPLVPRMQNVHVLRDVGEYQGPLKALHDVWERTEIASCNEVFVTAGDLPGLTPTVLHACQTHLQAALSGRTGTGVSSHVDGAVVLRDGRMQPLLGCYRPSAGHAWAASVKNGEARLMAALAELRLVTVDAEAEGWPEWWTRPVHTPNDYDSWLTGGMG